MYIWKEILTIKQKREIKMLKVQSSILVLSIALIMSACGNKPKETKSVQTAKEANMPAIPQKVKLPEEEALLRAAAMEGLSEKVEDLLFMKVDVNAMDENGRTALMLAAYNGHLQILKMLVEKGAEINLQDFNGRTSLMFASSGKFPASVKFLLEKGADFEMIDKDEHFTALMFAGAEGNDEVVKILLSAGADPSRKDVDGETALDFAQANGHGGVVELLK